jgi:phosphatidylglycerophosphatase C
MTGRVVVFDLDGTLTRTDTSLPFLRAVAGAPAMALALATLVPCLPLDLRRAVQEERAPATPPLGGVGGRLEGRLHERLCRRLLQGRPRAHLATVARQFAERRVCAGLRPEAVATLHAHRQAGDRLWIVSASLDLYLAPLVTMLGVEGTLGTRLHFDGDVATGAFAGAPCWGREKVRRLRAALGEQVTIHRAYGNGTGDDALLAMAAQPVRVRARGAWPVVAGP